MKRMNQRNLRNIRGIFEEKTGVSLDPIHRQPAFPVRKLWVLAAAVLASLAMAAFTWPLFSSLDGDALSLSATYAGEGVILVSVENRSDKMLEFQKQTKLMRWVSSEELPRLPGEPIFENTVFKPHSRGVMTIDLSPAYDMKAIEENYNREEWFYLLLTNNDFLFGQDWMCSVSLGTAEPEPESTENIPSVSADPAVAEEIQEELRFYFEDSYGGELMAFNGANFQYQQKVDELLARFGGTVVPALGPVLMVGGPSEFLEPEPMMGKPPAGTVFDKAIPEDRQYLLTGAEWSYTDGYGRMVAAAEEKSWVQTAMLPQREGETDGGVSLPLVFLFVYDAQQAKPEHYAFIYGQLHSFAELESRKVLEDEHYAVYNATDLIYRDVDAYLDHFLTTRSDVYCDAEIRRRVHNIYNFYQDPDNIRAMYGYLELP